jgi:predicted nucleotidyltransferase
LRDRAESFLSTTPAAEVVRQLGLACTDLPSLMIVGATCRDALHRAAGYDTTLRGTDDIDLALAVPDWGHYEAITSQLDRAEQSTSGIRYLVAGMPVDLMPFGRHVEEPDGAVSPAPRGESMSVFGFQDVWNSAEIVEVGGVEVRLPTVPGYMLLKLRAWLDRVQHPNFKDGPDIACAMYWYVDPQGGGEIGPHVTQRLYDTVAGQAHLEATAWDPAAAAVRLLVEEAVGLLETERSRVLADDWARGPEDPVLAANLHNGALAGWPPRGSTSLHSYAAAIRQTLAHDHR